MGGQTRAKYEPLNQSIEIETRKFKSEETNYKLFIDIETICKSKPTDQLSFHYIDIEKHLQYSEILTMLILNWTSIDFTSIKYRNINNHIII